MKEEDRAIVRMLMNAEDDDNNAQPKKPKLNEIKITSAPKTIVIESGGKKHQVPTMNVFNGLLSECQKQKKDFRDAQTHNKKLTKKI